MDRTSWKPKIFKATESADYKVNEDLDEDKKTINRLLKKNGSVDLNDFLEESKASELAGHWTCMFCGIPFKTSFVAHVRKNHTKEEFIQLQNDGWVPERSVYSRESKANEDDHKKSWDELDSIAKKGFSDIGYDQKSWDSEPEEVRAEMETVVKDNMSKENWKDMANKFYKEELNKDKKSGGEGLIPYQELLNHTRVDKEGDFVLCNYCNQTYDLGEMDELIDNNTITKHLYGHGIRSPVVTAYDVLKDTESKADDIRNAIAQDHEQWRKKQEPEQARQFLNNYQIPLSNKQSDYYPYDWGNQNNFSEDGFALSDTLAKNQGQSWQEGEESKASELSVVVKCNDCGKTGTLMEMAIHKSETGHLDNQSGIYESYSGESSMNCTKCQTRVWDKNGGMMNGSYNEELDGNSYTVCGNCGDKYKLRTFETEVNYETEGFGGGKDYESKASEAVCSKCNGSGDYCVECPRCSGTGVSNESKASEGFNQGLYGYVDAKCKTCGVEFDSIPDMDDHYAMHSDHVSNLDDLDSDIPNSD
jgi:hypothetical protein